MHPDPEKIIYFVRHGQDEQGKRQLYQDADSPLTQHGKEQARAVAESLRALHIDRIITSPMKRAHDTARIIAERIGLPEAPSDLFREFVAPNALLGTERGAADSIAFIRETVAHKDDPEWHSDGEENLHDIHHRAAEALEYLQEQEEKHLLVVTHAGFMRSLLTAMMTPEPMPDITLALMKFLKPANTGITEVHYHPDAAFRNTWRLVTWNVHGHLKAQDVDPDTLQA
jgi:broad specificity phosphatase PhoE